MKKYICTVCGFIYDESSAELDPAGNKINFEDLEPEWICPNCGVTQDLFNEENNERDQRN